MASGTANPTDRKPAPGGGAGAGAKPGAGAGRSGPGKQQQSGKRSTNKQRDLEALRPKLAEVISMGAVGQGMLAGYSGDERHAIGAQVTAHFAEPMANALVDLAAENERVYGILSKMVEGSAFGGLAVVTIGFLYSQAQVYGAVSPVLPNPWTVDADITVPPSPEVRQHAAGNGASPIIPDAPVDDEVLSGLGAVSPPPDAGQAPPPSGVAAPGSDDADATAIAEAQRLEAEAARKRNNQNR